MLESLKKEVYHANLELVKQGLVIFTWGQGGKNRGQVEKAARIEIALRKFLKDKGAKAFTTNFDNLENVDQIPGLASQ